LRSMSGSSQRHKSAKAAKESVKAGSKPGGPRQRFFGVGVRRSHERYKVRKGSESKGGKRKTKRPLSATVMENGSHVNARKTRKFKSGKRGL